MFELSCGYYDDDRIEDFKFHHVTVCRPVFQSWSVGWEREGVRGRGYEGVREEGCEGVREEGYEGVREGGCEGVREGGCEGGREEGKRA